MAGTISAVIPCKDRPQQLDRALTSIARQTVRPDEVIIVDDGSCPPLALAREYSLPITVIRQDNRGPAAARNRGIREAVGEWIALLDSDDTWVPEKTERQLRLIAEYPDSGFCVCNMLPHGRAASEFPLTPPAGAAEGIVRDALERLLPGRFISTSGVMFRKDLFWQVGGFDESLWFCEDYELWVRLAAVTPVVATMSCLNEVYREGGNLSDIEYSPVAGEIVASIFRKLMVSSLLDLRTREHAARILGKKLYDLAYGYRKNGQPLACCGAAIRSLANQGPIAANLKNFLFCWADLLLPKRPAARSLPA